MIEDRDGGDDGMRPEDAKDCQEPERTPKVTPGAGYSKSFIEHQFKKGVSGNPKGRPKRKKADVIHDRFAFSAQPANRALMEEMSRLVTVREGGKVTQLPLIQAIFRSLGASALTNRSAQKLLMDAVQKVENSDRVSRTENMQTMIEYKLNWKRAILAAEARGLKAPYCIPHPDDIIIDFSAGEGHINGPITDEEKVTWDDQLAVRDGLQTLVSECALSFEKVRKPEKKELHLERWIQAQYTYDTVNDNFPRRYRKDLTDRYWEAGSQPGSQRTCIWPGEE